MATKTPATDPLAGLPAAGPSTPKAPRTVKTSGAPATSGNVVNLSAAKAARKRKRLTADEYRTARSFAAGVTGYDETSPIWGKRMTEVLTSIEAALQDAAGISNGADDPNYYVKIEEALRLNQELQKRIATNAVVNAQR